ncbi:MAG TPA: DUF6602 domain-containing protein [Longimicrobium sp.]|nr:DUF6602 domain-containing protein [Longimicrobium sp.]
MAQQMRLDFTKAQNAFSHSGLKGSANEETLRKFLQQYLPRSIEISGGQLIDSEGTISKELDLVLSDAFNTPIFFESDHTRVIPIECAYAVFEVKAFLDKAELIKSYNNMKSVKALVKKAFFGTKGDIVEAEYLYGQWWEHWPVQHFVFAYDSSGLDSLKANLDELQAGDPVHQRIDSICVLDKGVVLNRDSNGGITATPVLDSVTFAYETDSALLFFYATASIVLNQVRMRRFNFQPYIRSLIF